MAVLLPAVLAVFLPGLLPNVGPLLLAHDLPLRPHRRHGLRHAPRRRGAAIVRCHRAPRRRLRAARAFGCGDGHHRCALRQAAAHVDRGTRHRLAAHQRVARHHGHAVGHTLVAVHDGLARHRDLPAAAGRAVVHAFGVARRVAVPGHVHLARRQRHPAHRRAADVDGDADTRRADPGHQRRRIHRAAHVGARVPGPAVAPEDPAAVVEGREAPGRVVDPGPAPGADPGPAAVAVRRPVGLHRDRHPHGAVLGVAFPAAVAVQFLGAGHLGRHVAVGGAALVAAVLARHPVAELVVGQRVPLAAQAGVVLVAPAFAPQLGTPALGDGEVAAVVVHAQFAAPGAGVGGVVDAVDAVVAAAHRQQAGLVGEDHRLRRHLAVADAHRQLPAVQLQRDTFVVHARQLQFAARAQAQRGRADAQLGARITVCRQAVAGGQRAVARRFRPLALLTVVVADTALQVGQPADTARRVVFGPGGQRQQGRGGQRQQRGCTAAKE